MSLLNNKEFDYFAVYFIITLQIFTVRFNPQIRFVVDCYGDRIESNQNVCHE